MRRLLGHNPDLLQAFENLSTVVSSGLSLPSDLREEVRAHLAVKNGCAY
jgi:alkylhydroperoxidase family enzyme